ncbi:uncharacterized protein LOC141629659 [Silene latifolia]|uniref:uncharacterized protein LOC141629659 n=1 Tax=Silene latifolia TaxID=37657 RepID=UPI003D7896AE
MIISSWNIRGFNDPIKQQEVRGYLATNKIEVFGLLETRVRLNKAAAISRMFSSHRILNNYSHHYNGRIWVFLDTRLVTLLSSRIHDQLIHLELLHHVSNKVVHMSFVFGSNDADIRETLWNEMRQLATMVTDWIVLGDFNIVTVLSPEISDHSPLLVQIKERYQIRRRFSYLNYWEEHKDYDTLVTEAWQIPTKGNAMFNLFAKLKNVRQKLIGLHKNNFSDLATKVKQARESLETCQKQVQLQPLDIQLLTQEKALLETYWLLRKTERSSLIQRAKIHDINYNDAANSYFYAKIAIRKHQSIIGKIKDKDGILREGMEDVNTAFVDYYQWPVEEMEIRKALFSIASNKSPGQDRFSSQFLKKSWNHVKREFCAAVRAYFKTGVMSKQANTTLLELIPKKPVVTSVMDYRPIACCTVFYKTVSKILCDRLKPHLPILVGKEHGAFVAGRCIFENIMLTQSLIKGYGHKGISPRCMIKVDIKKLLTLYNGILLVEYCRSITSPFSSGNG